jgi:hypothetical protein
MFEIDRITCSCCYDVLFIQYIDEIREEEYEQIYKKIIVCETGYYCEDCVMECEGCNVYIENIDCDNSNGKCNICFKKSLISSTYNNITKTLPVELIDMILCSF